MLDTDTKRRIDTARDILVGKVPDPKSQVEQITIALIYKFMDDMDAESEEFGGQRKFFAGDFARYGWAKLMQPGLGGFETLNLYAEAITKMPENPGIPPLFRDIFKNAFLPYRDPETLKMFLKVINEFNYDHSEKLGDAFEYLLSVLGSQGDAGQFRTPRHIIDFMVEIIDPKKTESILDPACGTAGFLISAYKHILKQNSSPSPIARVDKVFTDRASATASPSPAAEKGKGLTSAAAAAASPSPLVGEGWGEGASPRAGDLLTPDEKGRLAQNIKGYDISPDMVRLSLVNLYLHGFPDPHIYEYDALTSQDRWNDYADVILANPPFMSPKGGIMPHNRFSVQSKRSEVLFVDYMAEHLKPNGRAGIIVPEGIIFQSQTAYKQLRKMLVDEYLVAVISLPAGVFNPYAGVKTSILILDKSLAKKTNSIAFFKVENDGYGLGAQRREIEKNDLPAAAAFLKTWLQSLRSNTSTTSIHPIESIQSTASIPSTPNALIVEKEKLAANGEYNLSGERYREVGIFASSFPLINLSNVCEIVRGTPITREQVVAGNIPVIAGGQKPSCFHNQSNRTGETITVSASGAYSGFIAYFNEPIFASDCLTIKPNENIIITKFLFHLLKSKQTDIYNLQVGMGQPHVSSKGLAKIPIPLPPLDVQKEIVAEIEGYQKVIDGARAVLDNYKPHIPIDPEWPIKRLGDISGIIMGQSPPGDTYNTDGKGVPLINGPVEFGPEPFSKTVITQYTTAPTKMCQEGDLILCVRGSTTGRMNVAGYSGCIGRGVAAIRSDESQLWIGFVINSLRDRIYSLGVGSTFPNITSIELANLPIPLPPLATQQAIVAEIEAEQALVNANRELITRFEKKIQATLARVWGEQE